MKSKIALIAVAVFTALSLSACGSDDANTEKCILVNNVNSSSPTTTCAPSSLRVLSTVNPTTTTQLTTTSATPTTTTTTSNTTTTTTTASTTPSTVTVYAPPPTTAAPTTTVAAPPAAAEPRFTGYVNVGQAALCGGSRIESYDSGGITLNDATLVFRHNGFSLTPVSYPAAGTPPFKFAAVIVTQAGTETSFSGNLLFAPDGNLLTSDNAGSGDFWLNSSIQADGYVFCDAPPTLR